MSLDGSPESKQYRTTETGYVVVDDTRLHYRTAGEGEAVVFLHAGVADSRLWNRQLETFADQYRVVVYDLRGYGKSELPPQPYAHYRDLELLLDTLNVGTAHFVGASMGGSVVLDFALVNPDRVQSLTLVAPAVGGYEFTDEATLAGWEAAETAYEAGEFDRAADIESEMWLAGPTRTLDDVDSECRELVQTMLRQHYDLDTAEAAEEGLNPPAVGRLDELAVPVLVVSGTLDTPDMAAITARLERELADVRCETVDDAAHLPSLERPDEFDELLASFLDDVDESSSTEEGM
ncbi:alpha/beta fold hydrolase [Halogranum rubrum]|uniref:AB hydrolase-1 domain-containing protein n=1 Tax=Halogranum salarium B-1 TaxID=1210908 RepID=J3JF03_9EURY|nr:alpha/beta hydrolase [Halogranum salarium]EJN58796.1 hypothetical protein HSB1_28770 [Halogranum salarium B-1]